MPRDTAGRYDADLEQMRPGEGSKLNSVQLDFGPDIGAALKAARESLGLSISQVSASTRIKPDFLLALEDMRLGDLPARPFTLGYIRNYAELVGFDADAAVERFRGDAPDADGQLRAPLGVEHSVDPRWIAASVTAGVLIVLIAAWNLSQRGMLPDGLRAQPVQDDDQLINSKALQASVAGPVAVQIRPPAAPPPEADMPEPYLTPGLAAAEAEAARAVAAELGASPQVATPQRRGEVELGTPVEIRGAMFGSGNAPVLLQATRSVSLILRDAKGDILFARQLAAGDTYGVRPEAGQKIEVTEPLAVRVYSSENGYRGTLPGPVTALNRLGR